MSLTPQVKFPVAFFMAKMTINRARKILGQLGVNLTDKEIEEEIVVAEFFAELALKEFKISQKTEVQLNGNA